MRHLLRLLGAIGAASLAAVVILVAWPRGSAPLPLAARHYVIMGVRVIDVEAGSAGPPSSVVIRGGRIASIGGRADGGSPVRIDGRGRYLVPAYWDMHAHAFQHSPQTEFPIWIANGVTHVRDMMDCPGLADSLIACAADKRSWAAAIEVGELTGPRFVELASYYLEDPRLTADAAALRVRTYHRRGLGAVKVYNRLPRAAYFRAAHEARLAGMRLVGHLPKAVSLDEAIAAGHSSFEHGHVFARHCFRRAADWRGGRLDRLPPVELAEMLVAEHEPSSCRASFERLRQAGAVHVPTHVTREEDARAGDRAFGDQAIHRYLDPLSLWAFRDDLQSTRSAYPGARGEAALRAYFEHGLRLTGAAHAAGVPILVGTDTALGGFRYHDEMAHLVRAGLSPAEVLRAATIEAARYAGLEQASGSIEVGKRADLVLLNANPLDDIANTRRIEAVFLGGRLLDREKLDALLRFARANAASPHHWAKLLWGFARSSVTSEL